MYLNSSWTENNLNPPWTETRLHDYETGWSSLAQNSSGRSVENLFGRILISTAESFLYFSWNIKFIN